MKGESRKCRTQPPTRRATPQLIPTTTMPLRVSAPHPAENIASRESPSLLGPVGSSSSQYRRTLELVLQKSHASFRITSSFPVRRPAKWVSSIGHMAAYPHGFLVTHQDSIPLGPLDFECSQHRQTLRPYSSRDPQQSPAYPGTSIFLLKTRLRGEWLKRPHKTKI